MPGLRADSMCTIIVDLRERDTYANTDDTIMYCTLSLQKQHNLRTSLALLLCTANALCLHLLCNELPTIQSSYLHRTIILQAPGNRLVVHRAYLKLPGSQAVNLASLGSLSQQMFASTESTLEQHTTTFFYCDHGVLFV